MVHAIYAFVSGRCRSTIRFLIREDRTIRLRSATRPDRPAPGGDRRDASRLLVVDRANRPSGIARSATCRRCCSTGDLMVRNTARVLPARIHARKNTGGQVECLLLYPTAGREHLVRPAQTGTAPQAGHPIWPSRNNSRRKWSIKIRPASAGSASWRIPRHSPDLAEAIGEMPLPPYVDRRENRLGSTGRGSGTLPDHLRPGGPDGRRSRADCRSALHLRSRRRLLSRGIETTEIILHVGLGTFRPIESDRIEDHPMHAETYEIPAQTRDLLARDPATTEYRSRHDITSGSGGLSPIGRPSEWPRPWLDQTDLFIYPPASIRSG